MKNWGGGGSLETTEESYKDLNLQILNISFHKK